MFSATGDLEGSVGLVHERDRLREIAVVNARMASRKAVR
jgi:hypothetical protein